MMNEAKKNQAAEIRDLADRVCGSSKKWGERIEAMGETPFEGMQLLKRLQFLPKHLQTIIDYFGKTPPKELARSLQEIEIIGNNTIDGLTKMRQLDHLAPTLREMLCYFREEVPNRLREIAEKIDSDATS